MQQLLAERKRYAFLLLAYVFMPDHAHFVIVPAPGYTTTQTMRIVKGSVARRVNGALGTKGAIWQEGFYDRIAHTLEQLNAYVEYVHKNPCEAGIAGSAEDLSVLECGWLVHG